MLPHTSATLLRGWLADHLSRYKMEIQQRSPASLQAIFSVSSATSMASNIGTVASCITLALIAGLILARALPAKRPKIANTDVLGKDPGLFGFGVAASISHYNARGWRDALTYYINMKNRPYYIFALDRTILPSKYLTELMRFPESVLSHRETIIQRHLGKYNGMDIALQGRVHADIVRVQLTNNIGTLLPLLNEELEVAISALISPTEISGTIGPANLDIAIYVAKKPETVRVNANDLFFKLVASMTTRAYIGLPLARDQEWLSMVVEHPKLMFAVTATLKQWPSWLRPLIARHTKAKQQLMCYHQKLHNKLDPLIEERRQLSKLPRTKRHFDLLQWLVDTCKGPEASNEHIVWKLMFLNLAAITTTVSSITQVMMELCQRREYIRPLREEARMVLGDRKEWSISALKRLRKLDSFMKEASRLNPAGFFGFARLAMQPVELTDGFRIPKGEYIGIATGMIAQDESNFANAQDFDGFRFTRLRDQPGQEENSDHYFSGTCESMMAWGLGRSTCPGRWYAEAQMKLILVMLLTEHEFEFPEGQINRPDNIVMGDLLLVRKDQELVFRKTGS